MVRTIRDHQLFRPPNFGKRVDHGGILPLRVSIQMCGVSFDLLDVPDELFMTGSIAIDQASFVIVRHLLRYPRRLVVAVKAELERLEVRQRIVVDLLGSLAIKHPFDHGPSCEGSYRYKVIC